MFPHIDLDFLFDQEVNISLPFICSYLALKNGNRCLPKNVGLGRAVLIYAKTYNLSSSKTRESK